MKVALVLERYEAASGGQAIWTQGLVAHLHAAGHEVHVVSCELGAQSLAVRTHLVPWCWSPLARAGRFARALRALQPDVVHDAGATYTRGVWQPHSGSEAHSFGQLIATEPPVRRVRAALSPKMLLLRSQMAALEKMQASRASRIIAVSPFVRDLLAARHPNAAGKIQTIPNGVDYAFFSPAALTPLRDGARRSLRLGEDVLFLAVAHNPRLKGIDTVFRALAALRRDRFAVRLALAGNDGDPAWRRLAADLGVADRIHFLGQVGDMRPIYAAADVLVHPTRWDACSLVGLEGLACGLPVITTPRNGACEALEAGVSGLILRDPNDVAGLAALMRTLLDAERRRSFGAAARRATNRDLRHNYACVEAVLVRESSARRDLHQLQDFPSGPARHSPDDPQVAGRNSPAR